MVAAMIMIMNELAERDRDILDFEVTWWKYAGAKESEIRARFGIGGVRYYQVLNWIIDQPAAMAYAPMTVKRLQRLRAVRAEARTGRRSG